MLSNKDKEANEMATKSILKTVKIRDKKLCRSFAEAIEKTQHAKAPSVEYERKCTEINRENVKEFFDKF